MRARPSAQNSSRPGRCAGFTFRLLGTVLDLLGRLLPGLGAAPVPVPVPSRPGRSQRPR